MVGEVTIGNEESTDILATRLPMLDPIQFFAFNQR
jgi:hypothetical protein